MSRYEFIKNGEPYEVELSEEEEREILAQKKSITLYSDRLINYQELTDQELGAAMRAVIDYALEGTPLPAEMDRYARMYAANVIAGFEHSDQKYIKKCLVSRMNGQKGGRPSKSKEKPKKTQSVSMETQKNPTKPDTDTTTDTDNDTDTETDTDIERIIENTARAPSLSEVKDLFRKESLNGNPETFFLWWEDKNWKRNGKPVNWESEARIWASREKKTQSQGSRLGTAPNRFHNFHQREDYNYDELEKELLMKQW